MSQFEIVFVLVPKIVAIIKRVLRAVNKSSPGGKRITPEERDEIIWGAAAEVAKELDKHLPKAEGEDETGKNG